MIWTMCPPPSWFESFSSSSSQKASAQAKSDMDAISHGLILSRRRWFGKLTQSPGRTAPCSHTKKTGRSSRPGGRCPHRLHKIQKIFSTSIRIAPDIRFAMIYCFMSSLLSCLRHRIDLEKIQHLRSPEQEDHADIILRFWVKINRRGAMSALSPLKKTEVPP